MVPADVRSAESVVVFQIVSEHILLKDRLLFYYLFPFSNYSLLSKTTHMFPF